MYYALRDSNKARKEEMRSKIKEKISPYNKPQATAARKYGSTAEKPQKTLKIELS